MNGGSTLKNGLSNIVSKWFKREQPSKMSEPVFPLSIIGKSDITKRLMYLDSLRDLYDSSKDIILRDTIEKKILAICDSIESDLRIVESTNHIEGLDKNDYTIIRNALGDRLALAKKAERFEDEDDYIDRIESLMLRFK